MPQQLQVLNLAFDSSSHVAADELFSGDNLESNLLAGAAVYGKLDLAKGALAEGLDDVVLADALVRLDLVVGTRRGLVGRGHVVQWVGAAFAFDENLWSLWGRGVDIDSRSSHLGAAEGDGELAAVVVAIGGC